MHRAARAIAATGVGVGLLGSSFLLHLIAETVSLVTAFGGRDASGESSGAWLYRLAHSRPLHVRFLMPRCQA